MKTHVTSALLPAAEQQEAEAMLRQCVHCGFCNATCPTYQLLGDELDGPRGRIYLIKQMLEGGQPGPITRTHLDRCLQCRSCETTCPSGVPYARLLHLGRAVLDQQQPTGFWRRWAHRSLLYLLMHPRLWMPGLAVLRGLRPCLPTSCQRRIPEQAPVSLPQSNGGQAPVLFQGCVQTVLAPEINAQMHALAKQQHQRLQCRAGESCCGALHAHLGEHKQARALVRRNLLCWQEALEAGQSVVVTASGCAAHIRDYAQWLPTNDPLQGLAQRLRQQVRDPAQVLKGGQLRLRAKYQGKQVAFQAPCSQQHGMQLQGAVEACLRAAGVALQVPKEAHLCCGSAGSWSLFHPHLSRRLRQRKLQALLAAKPDVLVTANIGCLLHLKAASPVPVLHWLSLFESR